MAHIAVGGFHHETNTFSTQAASLEAFLRSGGRPALNRGQAMLSAVAGYTLPITGFVDTVEPLGHQLLPLLWGEAMPSAPVAKEAFETISGWFLEDLRALMASGVPPEALFLCLHGAMVAEGHDDGEGEFLRRVRLDIGGEMPVVATLDLHANVSLAMVEQTTALLGYRTYPHVDRYETGERAARLLHRLLSDGGPVARAYRAIPFLIPMGSQCTLVEPMASIYAMLPELERERDVLTVSFLAGFPLADVPVCGPTVVAYARSRGKADWAADAVANAVTSREAGFALDLRPVQEAVHYAISRARTARKTIVLADTQDNPGCGGTCDTVGVLSALIEHGAQDALIALICDPDAAAQAHAAGEGAEIEIDLGGRSGIPGEAPLGGKFVVERLGDGSFTATGPFYKGYRMKLGPMALLRFGGVRIIVASRKQQAGDKEIFRHLGVEPGEHRIVVLKSSVHFRADFSDIAEEILVVEAPGAHIANPDKLRYQRLREGIRVKPMGQPFHRLTSTA